MPKRSPRKKSRSARRGTRRSRSAKAMRRRSGKKRMNYRASGSLEDKKNEFSKWLRQNRTTFTNDLSSTHNRLGASEKFNQLFDEAIEKLRNLDDEFGYDGSELFVQLMELTIPNAIDHYLSSTKPDLRMELTIILHEAMYIDRNRWTRMFANKADYLRKSHEQYANATDKDRIYRLFDLITIFSPFFEPNAWNTVVNTPIERWLTERNLSIDGLLDEEFSKDTKRFVDEEFSKDTKRFVDDELRLEEQGQR